MAEFVGRAEPLARLTAAYAAGAGLALVTGDAGIGKTALLSRFGADLAAAGAAVVWGTCWDGEQAPAWWPWTQALRGLLDGREDLDPRLAAVLPELGPRPEGTERLQVFDAVAGLLVRTAVTRPVVVILDDLQWADRSTVDLMRYLVRRPGARGVLLVGAYRPRESRSGAADVLAGLATAAELVALRGLPAADVEDLVRTIAGDAGAARWAAPVYQRSGGHPFFARELCHLLAAGGAADAVPTAIREVIDRRLARLPAACTALLDAAAVAGATVQPDVLAEVCDEPLTTVVELLDAAAGVLAGDRFAHDLFRETLYTRLPPARRLELHHRIATALIHRHERGSDVFPAELARHFAAAVAVAGPDPALRWARAAAEADSARFAFADAAGHLARARTAVTDAGRRLTRADLVHLLASEADLRLRAGDADAAGNCSTRHGAARSRAAKPTCSWPWRSGSIGSVPGSPCRERN